MAIDALVAPFLRVEIFQGLQLSQIEEIARGAERIVFRPGDVIVNGSFSGEGAVLLVSGEAVVASERGYHHETTEPIPAGSLLNEMAMLIETELSLIVFARTTVRALKISRATLYQQMVEDPAIAEHFIAKISGRLTDFVEGFRACRADVRRRGCAACAGLSDQLKASGAETRRAGAWRALRPWSLMLLGTRVRLTHAARVHVEVRLLALDMRLDLAAA